MVHVSIVSRILIWYQQAAGWTGTSSSTISSSSPQTSTPSLSGAIIANTIASSPLTLTQCTGFAVAQGPISMGTFSIEDENVQAIFRNQLVLSELKKIASIIDCFTIAQDSSEPPAIGVTCLYSYLGVWLRNELSKTVTVLRARVRELNKSLES
jgi:hypothetical protein